MNTPIQLYKAKNACLSKDYGFPELSPEVFYSELFPLASMEKKGDSSLRSSNPIFAYKVRDAQGRVFFRNEIVFSDHFEDSISLIKGNEMALCSMCTYSGRKRLSKNAYTCNGFIIDLDGVGVEELQSLFGHIQELKDIPMPTYVANSGHGLHIYYLFENPVPLYPNVADYLQRLKRGLTYIVWQKETSTYDVKDRQFQGIYQCFRMVGSCTKLGQGKDRKKYLVKVFRTGRRIEITTLNHYVEKTYRCPSDPDYSSWDWADGEHHTLEECRTLYPDWYQRRIVNKEPSQQYKCSRGLYDWWYNKLMPDPRSGILSVAKDGNRYHCVSMLYVFAIKCMIPFEQVDADAMNLLDPFNAMTQRPDNEFTIDDIEDASKFYNSKYVRMTRKEIERRTGVRIDSQRRNGRKQVQHCEIMRATEAITTPNWRENNGRKPKADIVIQWRKEHPEGKKIDCERETGLSRPTILKWWNEK